jgi:hypothetical protein
MEQPPAHLATASARAAHWDSRYGKAGAQGVSWYQAEPRVSLELIERSQVPAGAGAIDVGGGASVLVDRLVERGFSDLTVLDVSEVALREARERLGATAPVTWLQQDVLEFTPSRRFDLWHDRAVFHFLADPTDRDRYGEVLRSAVAPGGLVLIATFAEDGPEKCSGLPVVRYSADALARALGDGFAVTDTRREEHVTPGGVVQPFTWLAARRLG